MSKIVKTAPLPGSSGGFTMAVWRAEDVPVGSDVGIVASPANGAAGEMPELPDPLSIDWPSVHSVALGCGVEDRGIRDRYEAAEYGFEDGVQKAACCVPDVIYDADQMQAYARAAVLAEREHVAAMCDAFKEQRFASGNVREGSAARTLAEMIRART